MTFCTEYIWRNRKRLLCANTKGHEGKHVSAGGREFITPIEALEKLAECACMCDLMHGVSCDNHELVRAIRAELERRTMEDFVGDTKAALEKYRNKVSVASEMKTAIKKLADTRTTFVHEGHHQTLVSQRRLNDAIKAMEKYLNV